MLGYLSLLALFLLGGCFNLPIQSSGLVTVLDSEARPATAKSTSEEKAVSTYDPYSKVETTLQAPSGALSGSKITLPAGALALAVDLVVEESIPMAETSVVASLGIREDISIEPIGAGMIIRPSLNVDLTRPLTIAMPIDPVAGFRAWLRKTFLRSNEYYAVFYKSLIQGELRAGVIPSSSLRQTEDGQIQFEGYFGAFWLCKVSAPIEEKLEVKTDEPTVNASRVSVIESSGIVTEDVIAAKASIPEVTWSAVSLSLDSGSRQGQLTASIGPDRSLASCQADFRASPAASSGLSVEVPVTLNYVFSLDKKEAHSLVGRFRCLDDQGRLTISNWSTPMEVPADHDPAVAKSIVINGGSAVTSSTLVELTLMAIGAVEQYITGTANCSSDGLWKPYSPVQSWTLTQSNAQVHVYVKFRNQVGQESACISSSINHVATPPLSAGSLSINSNGSTTSYTSVGLSFSAINASEMYVTNTAACASSGNWEPYQSSRTWTLGQSSGTAIVYVKFRNMAGQESACISDSIQVQAPATTLAIAASNHHTCALLPSGLVKCWGYNGSGQLGQGHTNQIGDGPNEMGGNLPPVALGTGRTARAIAAGDSHSCALLDNDTVKCWGSNDFGQLGLGHNSTLGRFPNEMGDNLPTVNLGTGRTALSISSKHFHTCALLDNHTVKCWGYGPWGNLGNSSTSNIGDESSEMGDALSPVNLGTGRTAKSVSAGIHHTCALLDNDSIKCWGHNAYGQLGIGNTEQKGDDAGELGDALPAVALGTGRTAKSVAAGYMHTCAVLDNNAMKCWGSNEHGELGQGSTIRYGDDANEMGDNLPEINTGSGRTVLSISAAVHQSCARLDDLSIKCWGFNAFGELGIESTANMSDQPGETGDALPAVNLGSGRTALALGTGWHHVCAVLDNGSVKCWGYNSFGQLGLGHSSHWGDNGAEMGDALPPVSLFDIPSYGLKLWLRADGGLYQDASGTIPATATSHPIGSWQDRSGQGSHMTVAAPLDPATARPSLVQGVLNGHAAVAFSGSSNLANAIDYPYPNTLFIVARYASGPQGRIISGLNNNWLMGWYAGGMDAFYAAEGWVSPGTGSPGYSWYVYISDQTASSQRLFRGLQLISQTNLSGTNGPNGLSLGGWSSCCSEYSAAEVAEVIVYDQVLSTADRTSVVQYLNQRYGTN